MREHGRELRVADFIRDELADIIARQMRDPRVALVSVNEVKVSRDLSYADIYVSSLEARDEGSREALVDVLNGAAGFLRSELARRHSMRTTPKPRFHYDHLVEDGPRMDQLIDRARAEDERHGDGAPSPAPSAGGESGRD